MIISKATREVCEPLVGRRAGLTKLSPTESEALAFLLPLSQDYPGIAIWYRDKVVPGLRDGTRHLLRIERDGVLAGLGIAKNEDIERKICTVRVAPAFANRGIGVRIFDGLLKWLDDDQPHLTVTEYKLPLFERIFDYYGFQLNSVRAGHYVPNAVELGYNEQAFLKMQPIPIGDCRQAARSVEAARETRY